MQDDTMLDSADVSPFGCPLCANTGSKHAFFDEIMSYVTDNTHRVHLHELVTHVRTTLSEHLQIDMTQERIRQHFLSHACEQRVVQHVLNHVLHDLVDILAVHKSNCVVVSEEGIQSMDPKPTGVYIDAVKQVMSIYKQLDHTVCKS
jgi:hypothetical protein